MKTITVCIPTYEMGGMGSTFLKHSLDILATQTFKDFDIVISDQSKNDAIKDLCEQYKDTLLIHYYRNTEGIGSSSVNVNNAMEHADGKLLKILYLDDFLYSKHSLQQIADAFDIEKDNWLVTASEHSHDGKTFYRPFYPRYNKTIYLGNNTISCPSVVTVKNEGHLLFDEHLIWLGDVEYYKRYYDAFGAPKILNTINVVNRISPYQGADSYRKESVRATKKLKWEEFLYVLKKYQHGPLYWYYFIREIIKNFLKNIRTALRYDHN